MKICKKCGFINQDDAIFCSQCGQALPEAEETRDPVEHDHSYDTDFGDPMKEEEHYRSPAEQMVDKSRQENAGYLESNNGNNARDVFGNVSPVLRHWGARLTELIAGIVYLLAGTASLTFSIVRFAQTGTIYFAGFGFAVTVALIVIGIVFLVQVVRHTKAINKILENNPSELTDKKKTPEFGWTALTAIIMALVYCGFAAIVAVFSGAFFIDLPPFTVIPVFMTIFVLVFFLSILQQKNRGKK